MLERKTWITLGLLIAVRMVVVAFGMASQAFSNFLEQAIAEVAAKAVVDAAEPIHAERHNRGRSFGC